MSTYEGSKMQEADEQCKKFTSDEAVKLAVDTVKSMGIADAHRKELERAFDRGYQAAIDVMSDKLRKMILKSGDL